MAGVILLSSFRHFCGLMDCVRHFTLSLVPKGRVCFWGLNWCLWQPQHPKQLKNINWSQRMFSQSPLPQQYEQVCQQGPLGIFAVMFLFCGYRDIFAVLVNRNHQPAGTFSYPYLCLSGLKKSREFSVILMHSPRRVLSRLSKYPVSKWELEEKKHR